MAGLVPDVDIPIVVTGLRPGEKLTEELLTEDEEMTLLVDGKIHAVQAAPPPSDLWQRVAELGDAAHAEDVTRVIALLKVVVPSYKPAAGDSGRPNPASRVASPVTAVRAQDDAIDHTSQETARVRSDRQQTSVSVLVPVYNEQYLVAESLGRLAVLESSPHLSRIEIIVVDDCSTDGTADVLRAFQAERAATTDPRVTWRFLRHEKNGGKGKAIKTALEPATCEIAVIHDADLEYHPKDLLRIVAGLCRRGRRRRVRLAIRRGRSAARAALPSRDGQQVPDASCATWSPI